MAHAQWKTLPQDSSVFWLVGFVDARALVLSLKPAFILCIVASLMDDLVMLDSALALVLELEQAREARWYEFQRSHKLVRCTKANDSRDDSRPMKESSLTRDPAWMLYNTTVTEHQK